MPEAGREVVGTYQSVEEAERARAHLEASGVADVRILEVGEHAWEVDVPSRISDDALRALEALERDDIRRFF